MGFMGNMVSKALGRGPATVPAATQDQYIPANEAGGAMDVIRSRTGEVWNQAADVYRRNPKLIHGLGLLALAAIAVKVKQGR